MKVILKRRDDGKLYCQVYREIKDQEKQDRLERSLGKFFFPDKSWTDVCPGEAEVEITKEFENYGFIKGHMCRNAANADTNSGFSTAPTVHTTTSMSLVPASASLNSRL